MTGSWKGRGNQYIQLVKVLYCKLPTISFPTWDHAGIEPRPQRWEARVLPLCHCGPYNSSVEIVQAIRQGNAPACVRQVDVS